MNSKEFLWHAKRGHGECISILKSSDIFLYKQQVKRIVLNNYAFLKRNEYRSAYAFELACFYDDNIYFAEAIFRKLNRIALNDYDFIYLVDNLYFFIKNIKNNYEKRIENLLKKHLKKNYFTIDESKSICSILSLVLDLNLKFDIITLINSYFKNHKKSNLDLSIISLNYGVDFDMNVISRKQFDFNILTDVNCIINCISDNNSFDKLLSYIANYISSNMIDELFQYLTDNSVSNELIYKILKIIFFSGKCKIKNINYLTNLLAYINDETKEVVYDIICSYKSKRIKKIAYRFRENQALFLRIILKNYSEEDYELVRDGVIKLKIDYSNSQKWFEIEELLVKQTRTNKADLRLLNEIRYFLLNGLSSTSRYNLVKILKSHNKLTGAEIHNLKYDANWKIRNVFQ